MKIKVVQTAKTKVLFSDDTGIVLDREVALEFETPDIAMDEQQKIAGIFQALPQISVAALVPDLAKHGIAQVNERGEVQKEFTFKSFDYETGQEKEDDTPKSNIALP